MFSYAQALLTQELSKGACHGYVLAVGHGGKVLHCSAGGALGAEGSAPANPQTRYDLGSLTGVMVTLPLTLLALEKGWLSLTDKLSLYVDVPSDKRSVTLGHILCHASGMGKDFLLEQEAENAKDALRVIVTRPLSMPAGKQAQHSGMGMILLGKVLEQVYAMPLDEAARRHVFTPLGMKHTGYLPTGSNIAYTTPDNATGEPRVGVPNDENAVFLHGVSGEAGLFADAEDCCRYLAMLAGGGMLGGKAFLSRETVRLVGTEHTKGTGKAYGLGVQLSGRDNPFLGELWPKGGYGHASQTTGCSLAVDTAHGLYVALLMSRTKAVRKSDGMLRIRKLLHNSIAAEFLRNEAEQEAQK